MMNLGVLFQLKKDVDVLAKFEEIKAMDLQSCQITVWDMDLYTEEMAAKIVEAKEKTGAKTRGIEFSLMQRCAAHIASETDVQESFLSGKTAVLEAVAGKSDKMVGYARSYDKDGNYVCNMQLFDLCDVANTEKKVPQEMINEAGNNVTQAFIDYALPLIQGQPKMRFENGLPRFAKLKKVLVK